MVSCFHQTLPLSLLNPPPPFFPFVIFTEQPDNHMVFTANKTRLIRDKNIIRQKLVLKRDILLINGLKGATSDMRTRKGQRNRVVKSLSGFLVYYRSHMWWFLPDLHPKPLNNLNLGQKFIIVNSLTGVCDLQNTSSRLTQYRIWLVECSLKAG